MKTILNNEAVYYVIKCAFTENLYWSSATKSFTSFMLCDKFATHDEADLEAVEKASFCMPCHLIEINIQDN